jgi:hypothetical protein
MQLRFAVESLATARALTVSDDIPNALKWIGCGLATMTSTAPAWAMYPPDSGGLLTVTLAPETPLLKPLDAASARAAAVIELDDVE